MFKLQAELEDIKLSEFEVTHLLGGTNSQVFLARRFDKLYAIKVYSID